jgi:pyruvate,water dikinase
VVSREFGLPAVVGTSNATERIKTGSRVRLNGSTGIVEVIA